MKIDSNIRTSFSYSFTKNIYDTKQRVCRECSISLKEYVSIQNIFRIFNLIGLSFQDMLIVGQVNRQWKKVYSYYAKIFRNIQYRIPNSLNEVESIMLRNNIDLLKGHSVWIIQICKLTKIYGKKSNIIKNIHKSLSYSINQDKSSSLFTSSSHCWCIRCTRECKQHLSTEDAILCLESCLHHPSLLELILIPLLSCHIFELECYLQLIVHHIGNNDITQEIRSKLQNFLIIRCSESVLLSHSLFWLYTRLMEKNRSLFFVARTNLLKSLDKSIKTQIHSSYNYVMMLKRCSGMSIEECAKTLNNYSAECIRNIVTFPLKTRLMVVRNVAENIVKKKSKSNPFILPLDCMHKISYDTHQEKILIKKDDVRKDAIIMNCIVLMDNILKKANINLHIVDYRILPIARDFGIIEIVPASKTVHDIQNSNFSIQNFIFEHNSSVSIDDIRDQYMRSCAAYCLIGYLLGIGDRHLENIMITKSGFIFHIDFEFILGHDPKFIRPEIRITPEMIDAMGGYKSKYYIEFQNICKQAFLCLRRHVALFYTQLMLLAHEYPALEDNFTEDFIKMQVMKRFMVGENHADAELVFITKMAKSSSSSYKHQFVDYVHEKGNTIQLIGEKLTSISEFFGI
tara:strand:+ start:1084 stop:2964 length:1881 start_codon:yes stop_codon:yes gene_type:complete